MSLKRKAQTAVVVSNGKRYHSEFNREVAENGYIDAFITNLPERLATLIDSDVVPDLWQLVVGYVADTDLISSALNTLRGAFPDPTVDLARFQMARHMCIYVKRHPELEKLPEDFKEYPLEVDARRMTRHESTCRCCESKLERLTIAILLQCPRISVATYEFCTRGLPTHVSVIAGVLYNAITQANVSVADHLMCTDLKTSDMLFTVIRDLRLLFHGRGEESKHFGVCKTHPLHRFYDTIRPGVVIPGESLPVLDRLCGNACTTEVGLWTEQLTMFHCTVTDRKQLLRVLLNSGCGHLLWWISNDIFQDFDSNMTSAECLFTGSQRSWIGKNLWPRIFRANNGLLGDEMTMLSIVTRLWNVKTLRTLNIVHYAYRSLLDTLADSHMAIRLALNKVQSSASALVPVSSS